MDLATIFNDAQSNEAEHSKCLKAVRRLYKKNPSKFKKEIIPILQRILVVSQSAPCVERILVFIAKLICNNEELIEFFIEYLLDTAQVSNKTIRFRSCQIIAVVLENLPSDAEISTALWNKICKRIAPRMRDKFSFVRVEAVKAMIRMQDPDDEEDEVTSMYTSLMCSDTSGDVRKTVLQHISVTTGTISHIMRRTRDNVPEIRGLVYKVLMEYPLKFLDIDQRISLLRNGLEDRDLDVRRACVTMICDGWFVGNGGDILKVLSYLLVEKFDDIAEKVIKSILKRCDISWVPPKVKRNSPPILSPESILLWKVYLQRLQKRASKDPEAQQLLDRYAPEISNFCFLLKPYINNNFIGKQLVEMIKYLDLSDEARRRDLTQALSKFLLNSKISEDVKRSIMKILRLLHNGEDKFISMIIEIISDIQEPLESTEGTPAKPSTIVRGTSSFNLSGILDSMPPLIRTRTSPSTLGRESVSEQNKDCFQCSNSDKLAELHVLRKGFLNKGDALAVTRIEKEIHILEEKRFDDTLTQEERRWVHCMAVTEELLLLTHKDLEHPGIHDLLSNVILRYVAHTIPKIRERAIRCLGLFCMLNKGVARSYLDLFSQALLNDQLQVQCGVLKILIDLLLVYGIDGFEDSESQKALALTNSQQYTQNSMVDLLSGFLLHSNGELRSIAVEGFCKLMYSNQITDPKVLSKLIVLFFVSPDQVEIPKGIGSGQFVALPMPPAMASPCALIRQCLSEFLRSYSVRSLEQLLVIQNAFIPALREIIYNVEGYTHAINSEVENVNILRVAELFLYLTSTTTNNDNLISPHNVMACMLAKELLACPKEPCHLQLCKLFQKFELSKHEQTLKTLKYYTKMLIEKIDNDSVTKQLTATIEWLNSLDDTPEVELAEEIAAKLESDLEAYIQERKDYFDCRKEHAVPRGKLRPKASEKRISPTKNSGPSDIYSESDSGSDHFEEPTSPIRKTRQTPSRQSKSYAREMIGKQSARILEVEKQIRNLQEGCDESEESSSESEENDKTHPEENSGDDVDENAQALDNDDEDGEAPSSEKDRSDQEIGAGDSDDAEEDFVTHSKRKPMPRSVRQNIKRTASTKKTAKGQQPTSPTIVDAIEIFDSEDDVPKSNKKVNNSKKRKRESDNSDYVKPVGRNSRRSPRFPALPMKTETKKGVPQADAQSSADEDCESSYVPPKKAALSPRSPKRREETALNLEKIHTPQRRLVKTSDVIVAFGEGIPNEQKLQLSELVTQNSGKVFDKLHFSLEITHVVDEGKPNAGTLFAIVASKWLVAPTWIKDSAENGAFLYEAAYGVKCKNPIFNKKFFLDKTMKGDKEKLELCSDIVKVGQGSISNSSQDADIILVGSKTTHRSSSSSQLVFQWDQFMRYLFDHKI